MRKSINVFLRRIKLNSTGYDSFGSYYGVGAPVWRMTDADGGTNVDHTFRAANMQNARTYVRSAIDTKWGCDVKFTR